MRKESGEQIRTSRLVNMHWNAYTESVKTDNLIKSKITSCVVLFTTISFIYLQKYQSTKWNYWHTKMVALILIWLTILLVIFMNYNSEKFKYSCTKIIATKTKKLMRRRTIWDIPGPRPLPFIGTKWIFYLQKFRLSKLHEAYDGDYIFYIFQSLIYKIVFLRI